MPKKVETSSKVGELRLDQRVYEVTLVTDLLGTVPKNQDVYASYISTKAAEFAKNRGEDEKQVVDDKTTEEVETVETVEAKGWTGFHKDEKGLFLYSYMVKGFLKTAIEVLVENKAINKIPAYKKWIDRMIFIEPRRLHFQLKEPDGVLERPLRTMTAKGERVTVSRSDFIRAGRPITFTIKRLSTPKISWEIIETALAYGEYVGLGQWRGSGGYGQFTVKRIYEK